jgi:hypothetical protein
MFGDWCDVDGALTSWRTAAVIGSYGGRVRFGRGAFEMELHKVGGASGGSGGGGSCGDSGEYKLNGSVTRAGLLTFIGGGASTNWSGIVFANGEVVLNDAAHNSRKL